MKSRVLRPAFFVFLALVCVLTAPAAPAGSVGKSEAAKTESGNSNSAAADYVLQPQDVLKVQVFQEEDLMREVHVSQDYTINLPLIGTLDIKGKTAQQARESIRKAYDRDYLVNPQITVEVIKYSERTVNVVGQVNKPGQVEFPQEKGLTLVEAITRAGGPTRLANLKKVTLKRTKPDGTTGTDTINVEELMKGDTTETWPLRAGDVINVPERSI